MRAGDGIAVAACFTADGCGVLMLDWPLRLVLGWARPAIVMDGPLAIAGYAAVFTAAIPPSRVDILKAQASRQRYATLLYCAGRARRLGFDVAARCAISWDLTEDCQAVRNVVIRFKTVPSANLRIWSRARH